MNKEILYNKGIDTICLVVDTKYSEAEITKLRATYPVLATVNKVTITNDGRYKKIVFQPSNYIDRTKLLDNGDLFYQCIKESLAILDGTVISLDRIDIAMDSKEKLNNYKQLARLTILCAASRKNIRKAFTVKNLFDLKEKTVKLSSDRFVMTFYCREDKPLHEAEFRIEIRYQKLSQSDWENEAKEMVGKTIELFTNLEDHVKEVEDVLIPVLIDLYQEEIQEGILLNFSGFMDKYSDFFYTKRIFSEVYKLSELKGNENNWLKKFRKNRPTALSFDSKHSVKQLSSEVRKNLKTYLKTF
ncbi:hypothetical protein [uncultured Ilyobacter sp.]|uniref:hypothetical protein n=1 Tax=uncultured Ilyobacter sp. TaxID=544433 RepID=UPI0029C068BA|nr:hypothetical protein [uncultured Ilyobacter sp.]